MGFAVSAGAVTALDRAVLPPTARVQLSVDFAQDYAAIWRSQPQVRTVVGFLGRNIAQIGLHVYDRISDTDRKRLTDHPLARLLARPNNRTTRYRLIDALVNDLGIYDNAFWLKFRDQGQPQGLVRVSPDRVQPIGDNVLWADAYRVTGTRGYRDLTPDDLVHFRGYNPTDARWGVSPMETLRRILAEEYQAGLYREQLWRNGARFPGHIRRPKDAPDWGPESRERFRNDWNGLYTGNGPGAGGTPVLEDGMTFEANGVTPAQAQYLETRKLTREEVAAAYHIPLPMVGILDHATFSNIKEQHQQLYQDTLGPWLEMISQEIELQLLPDLDASGSVYVEFNLAEKMRGSFEEQAASLQTAVGAPWLTRNEARARGNLPAVDGGDALVTPLNVLTGGQASPTDSAPKSQITVTKALPGGTVRIKARAPETYEQKYVEVLSKFFTRQGRAVRSVLGAKAGGDWWDSDRWDGELSDDLYALAVSTSKQVATTVLDSLGFTPDAYNADQTLKFLRAVADSDAANINATTKSQITAALDAEEPAGAVAGVFDIAASSRAAQIATTAVTGVSGFAATEAGKQAAGDKATKTWITGSKPRPSHARMDGETVSLSEDFSNGLAWPGDGGDADEVAGCNCSLEISVP